MKCVDVKSFCLFDRLLKHTEIKITTSDVSEKID